MWLARTVGASPQSKYLASTRAHLEEKGLIVWDGKGQDLRLTEEGRREAQRIRLAWQSMLWGPEGAW